MPDRPPIGTVTMEEDGSLTLMLRATDDEGARGDALLTFGQDHPGYRETINRVGGLQVGETKYLYE